MSYVGNDLLIQKREELKNDLKLFLKVRPFEMEGDKDINDVLEEISNSFKDTYGKDVFDITSVDDFDRVRNESGYQSISIDEEPDLLDKIIDASDIHFIGKLIGIFIFRLNMIQIVL